MKKDSKHKSNPGAITEGSPISDVSHHKAAASKAFLENHYRDLLRDARSGTARLVRPREKDPTAEDFILIKCIGKGAYGDVFVCQRKGDPTNQLYALKRLRKMEMIKKKQIAHVRSEKDVLSEAALKNPWVVRLYMSFQDARYLYMVMEYMPAGDMISWLCEKGIFDVASTRFYIAELCAAVASVHAMYFVHRDIKPDNVLVGADGHIKLSDFGLCKRFAKDVEEVLDLEDADACDAIPPSYMTLDKGESLNTVMDSPQQQAVMMSGEPQSFKSVTSVRLPEASSVNIKHIRERAVFQSIVGSPGYIAPEILLRQPYSVNCDWWSVGVIMYEMLYGIPPFYAQDPSSTCHKITRWRDYLHFPSGRGIPDTAVDFIQRLVCDPADRMDYGEIVRHPFFEGIDFDHLREMKAAYQPVLSNPLDTKYFPEVEERSASGRGDDRTVIDVDPRGVMFADFEFNYNSNRRRSPTA